MSENDAEQQAVLVMEGGSIAGPYVVASIERHRENDLDITTVSLK